MHPIVILVAQDGRSDYGLYLREILRLEGLDADLLPLADLMQAALPKRVLIASNLPLLAEEGERLRSWAEQGARLVFFAPHPSVAEAFGFRPTYRGTLDGFLCLNTPTFPAEPMQFHGLLRHLEPPPQAEPLAFLCQADLPHLPTSEAIALRLPWGQGEVLCFLYDLPQSIALTRQGDPRRSGQHTNQVWPGWRAADMFADFLALECATIPQADVQCHWLRHLLTAPLPAEEMGLPFLWPFPHQADTVLLLSSDDDWSTPEQFEAVRDALRRHLAQMTWYLVPDTVVTPEWKQAQEAQGDTFSIHPVHREPLARTWNATVEAHRAAFRQKFRTEPGGSVRNHVIPWIGYLEGAHRDYQTGFTWDSNFFTCPPLTRHYMTGSGLPLPFVEPNGELLPVWQQPCQYSDETTLAAGGFVFSLNYTEDEAVTHIAHALQANAETYHSLLCINTHPVSFATYSGGLWERLLAFARERGIPLLALENFAAFWERRRAVQIGAGERTTTGWQWHCQIPADAEAVSLLVPLPEAPFYWNAHPVSTFRRTVQGVEYAAVPLPPIAGDWTLTAQLSPPPLP